MHRAVGRGSVWCLARASSRRCRNAPSPSQGRSFMAHDILIVDDEDDIRMLISGILKDEGYATREAPDGQAALEAIRARQPSLVILDIWLQGSAIDGLQVLESARREHPLVPIVMISGHGTIET